MLDKIEKNLETIEKDLGDKKGNEVAYDACREALSALKALCKELPNADWTLWATGVQESIEYYKTLKSWGKDGD